MASGKRASMREGPLAALFRKTEEDGLHGEGVPPQQAKPEQPREREPEPEPRQEFRTPAPASHVAPPEPELRPAPPSARRARPEPESESERRERRAGRSPEQRLREVFSTDIPENIMELSPPETSAPRYGGEEPRVSSEPAQVLQPVLRVVGVGGA